MYNVLTTLQIPTYIDSANSHIFISNISNDGSKQIIFTLTTPWNTIAPDSFAKEGDVFRWSDPSNNYILMMRVLTVDEVAKTATLELLSFAKTWTPYFSTSVTGLPTSARPGDILNYNFEVTNNTSNPTAVRWIFGSKESTGTTTFADWIQPDQLESFPPSTIPNKNCWYEDWLSGPCFIGQTIMPGGFINISGSLTIFATAGKRENVTLAVFVKIPNFWKTVNTGSPGGDEYVLSYVGDSINQISILSDPCAGMICTPDYTCQGCDSYQMVCNPADPTGPCIIGPKLQINDPRCNLDGYVNISSTPQGATIYIDDNFVGITGATPLIVRLPILTNPHSVKLVLTGYDTWLDIINVSCTGPISISPILTPPAPYELHLRLDSITDPTYVINSLGRFSQLFNNALLASISGITINSITYIQADNEIVIELQSSSSSLSSSLSPQGLPLWVVLFLSVIPIILWIPLLTVGLVLNFWYFVKKAAATSVEVSISTCIQVTSTECADPIEEVTVEFNGESKPANKDNSYTAIFSNVKAVDVETTYPVKAYIPLSPGSKVYKASYSGIIKPSPTLPRTIESIKLKINQTSERDYTICKKYTDNTLLEAGHIVRVYYAGIDPQGRPDPQEFGRATVQSDGCLSPIKVPSYFIDSMISTQVISNSIDPNSPSPIPQRGDDTTIKRINEMKNQINIYTYSTYNNPLVADKIEIKDLNTNQAIKTVTPNNYYTSIDEIPKGRYQTIVTKTGYQLSSCNPGNCIYEFTTDYLQGITFTVIEESLVKTCDVLDIYVLDKYGRELKTTPYIKIDSAAERSITGNKLELNEITATDHIFNIRADKYNSIKDSKNAVSCTDTAAELIFKMDPTGEDIISGSMELTVNDLKGTVGVEKNKSFTVKVTGANPMENVDIKNISSLPDVTLTSGVADATGTYQTTLIFNKDDTFEIQAMQGCIVICAKDSNIIELKIGAGAPECLVPNPLGGCLIEKTTGYGLMVLAGLGLVAAIAFLRPGGAVEMIRERLPPPKPKEIPPKELPPKT